jgi:hypothetical protein
MPTIIDPDTGITFTDLSQIGSGVSLGMRNRTINGNFGINQRVYVSAVATTVANQYTLDRWRVVTSGQSLVFSASGNGNSVTAPAGGLEQVIEGVNIEGGSYVVNWVGAGTCTVNGTARAKGETFTLPANTNATVRVVGVVSQFQLEPGTVATPFEHRPITLELALCQRYYETYALITGPQYPPYLLRPFKVTKRGTPTVTLIGGGLAGADFATSGLEGFRCPEGNPGSSYIDAIFGISAEL